jgi:subtilisin-like proprotein convertase family protein
MKQGKMLLLIGALVGTLVLAFAGLAGGKIKTKTFSSGSINEAFGSLGQPTITEEIDLNKKRFKRSKVKDVDVGVRISHSYNLDVDLSLTAPNGRSVDLSSDNGGSGEDDYGSGSTSCSGTKTVFNDEAETSIEDGSSPFNGQFLPEERLSTLDGSKVKGPWRLTVTDDFTIDTDGVLHCFDLKVKYKKKEKKN